MQINIINKSNHELPNYETLASAGMDFEIGVILVNLSKENFIIENGERIAQLVIAKHERATWQEVTKLSTTKRGEGGFGSTGTK